MGIYTHNMVGSVLTFLSYILARDHLMDLVHFFNLCGSALKNWQDMPSKTHTNFSLAP